MIFFAEYIYVYFYVLVYVLLSGTFYPTKYLDVIPALWDLLKYWNMLAPELVVLLCPQIFRSS